MTAEVQLLRLLAKGRSASTGWQPALEMVSLTTLTTSVESIMAVVILGPAAGFALQNHCEVREEAGWPRLEQTVAGVPDALKRAQSRRGQLRRTSIN